MSSHTKGPWEMAGDGAEIWPLTGPNAHCELARVVGVCGDSSWFAKEEAKANARLITAAPDLLEACNVAFHTITDELRRNGGDGADRWVSCVKLLMESIDKAERGAK